MTDSMSGAGGDEPTIAPSTFLQILENAAAAIWIYDVDRARVPWANRAGLAVWDAPSLEELRARDLNADMSPAVRLRLRQYQEDFERSGSEFYESWTLHPNGKPRCVRVKYSGHRFEDGRMGMLCQAVDTERAAPETIRSIEALLHTSVMISMFTEDGEPLYCNPAARACRTTICGTLGARFRHEEDHQAFRRTLDEKGSADVTVQIAGSSAINPTWHRITAFRCHDAVTGVRAILVSESDVTEMQETRAALEMSRNEALEANRLKTEFLANMSHEIRTPLNGVLGMAQLLKRTETSPQQARMVDTILASGETLLTLISDILDITRIEAGTVGAKVEPYSVGKLIAATIATVKGGAKVKGLRLVSRNLLDPDAEQLGDADLIHQVLVNLTGNAIKFSDSGTVRIAAEERGDRLRYSVSDEGPGIPASQHALVFEPFRQADGSAARPHGGTGLGLAIAKKLVERMDGSIGVDSAPGRGSTFWFEIPTRTVIRAGNVRRHTAPVDERALGARAAGARVLVVEDNAANRDIACEVLKSVGATPIPVRSAPVAMQHLSTAAVDMILLDLHMPVISGLQTLKMIRAPGSQHQTTPVIIMTADATTDARISALDAGADAFITKPLRIETLLELIVSLLDRQKAEAGPGD